MLSEKTVGDIIYSFMNNFLVYLPHLIAGLIIFLIGLIAGNIAGKVFLGLFKVFAPEKLFKENKFIKTLSLKAWLLLISQIIRWSIIILFLIAALETWGITEVGRLLNQLLLYLPNVIVAVLMGFIGMIVAGLTQDLVKNSTKSLGISLNKSFSSFAYYTVIIFTALLVLNQLGVAADLIKIFFTGLVAMFALAGGLAFGLGGQETAKKFLEKLINQFIENKKP